MRLTDTRLTSRLKAAESELRQGNPKGAAQLVLGRPLASELAWSDLFDAAQMAREHGKKVLAARLLESSAEMSPGSPEPRRLLGSWFQDDGDLKQAALHLRTAAALDTTSTSEVLLGWVQWDSGNDGAARKAFERAIELDPEDDEAWYGLGSTKRFQAPESAISDFQRARCIDPANSAAWREEGLCQMRMKRLDLATGCLRRAIALNPADHWAHEGMAAVLSKDGRDDDALHHLERATVLAPSEVLFRVHLGDALWRLGRHKEARASYKSALKVSPDAFLPNLRFGQLLLEGGEAAEALLYLTRAVQIDPKSKRANEALSAARQK